MLPVPPDPDRPHKPRFITTPASLAIIVGLLGTLACGAAKLSGAFIAMSGGADLRLADGSVFRQDQQVATYEAVTAALDLITSAALLTAGIGAMASREWARRVGMAAAAAMLVLGAVRLTATLTWVIPRSTEQAREVARAVGRMTPTTRAADTQAGPSTAADTQPTTRAAGSPTTLPATRPADGGFGEMAEASRKVLTAVALFAFAAQLAASVSVLTQWTRPEARAWFADAAATRMKR